MQIGNLDFRLSVPHGAQAEDPVGPALSEDESDTLNYLFARSCRPRRIDQHVTKDLVGQTPMFSGRPASDIGRVKEMGNQNPWVRENLLQGCRVQRNRRVEVATQMSQPALATPAPTVFAAPRRDTPRDSAASSTVISCPPWRSTPASLCLLPLMRSCFPFRSINRYILLLAIPFFKEFQALSYTRRHDSQDSGKDMASRRSWERDDGVDHDRPVRYGLGAKIVAGSVASPAARVARHPNSTVPATGRRNADSAESRRPAPLSCPRRRRPERPGSPRQPPRAVTPCRPPRRDPCPLRFRPCD